MIDARMHNPVGSIGLPPPPPPAIVAPGRQYSKALNYLIIALVAVVSLY
jgi:hypothetical protein